jgi:5-methylcytosine-specific restriction endonuclease McrA
MIKTYSWLEFKALAEADPDVERERLLAKYKAKRKRKIANKKKRRKRSKEYIKKRARQKREKLRKIILDAKNTPCMDCGVQKDIPNMTFDHVRGKKRFNISDAPSSKGQILDEIAKCEVVCRDCHDDRERQRGVMN